MLLRRAGKKSAVSRLNINITIIINYSGIHIVYKIELTSIPYNFIIKKILKPDTELRRRLGLSYRHCLSHYVKKNLVSSSSNHQRNKRIVDSIIKKI